MLNKLPVSEIAKVSGLSKSYISQVIHGLRPASARLLDALEQHSSGQDTSNGQELTKAVGLFLESRREGVSPRTISFYKCYLDKAVPVLTLKPTAKQLNDYFDSLSCSLGGKHAYYRAVSVFFHWLYSPKSSFKFNPSSNPIALVDAPKRPKRIMPSFTREQVEMLIEKAHSFRDKAIIALFTESGLRLSELTNIKMSDIDWQMHIIRTIGKGNKEGYAPFGSMSEGYLKQWLDEYKPASDKTIWDVGFWGIKSMLDELKLETGLPCNPHTFRRTFACLLRKAGLDSLTIKDLGRWESLEMVQRYTRSVSFNDSLKFYKAPLS